MGKIKSIEEMEARALELTMSNVRKGRTAKTGTHLGAFVNKLLGLDESTAKTRTEIISSISIGNCNEAFAETGGFDFENPEHIEAFAVENKKVKPMVAAAISNSNNNTSLSFNPTTKDKYELHRADSPRGEVYWITLK